MNVSEESSSSNFTVTQKSISQLRFQSFKQSCIAKADMKRCDMRKATSIHSSTSLTIIEHLNVFVFMKLESISTVNMQTMSASVINNEIVKKKLNEVLLLSVKFVLR